MQIEIIMAEFGASRKNAGDSTLPVDRLEPSLSSLLEAFPEATATVYTDQNWESSDKVTVQKVDSPFAPHDRKGHRENDYYQPYGILHSTADIAIAVDSDLLVVNEHVNAIIPLVQKFGVCMPSNGRHIAWRDAASTCDGGHISDDSLGMGAAHCTAFIAADPSHGPSRQLLDAYCCQVLFDANTKRGARGPLSFWRACWKTGLFPYTLPREWCITASNCGDDAHKGRTIPIILHVGHDAVKEHYAELLP